MAVSGTMGSGLGNKSKSVESSYANAIGGKTRYSSGLSNNSQLPYINQKKAAEVE
jgi:hypothetical protein